jgi:hypothetical protein
MLSPVNALERVGAPKFLLDTERVEWLWIAGENGKPGIPADFDSATEATMNVTDPLVTVLGTNETSALIVNHAEGGITIVTGATDNDETILVPHEDTNANQMHPDTLTWGTDRELEFECAIRTPATITTLQIAVGLTLDASPAVMSVATPDDFVMFNFETDGSNTDWRIVTDVGNGGPVNLATGITVVADTDYHFSIKFGSDGVARASINGMEFTSVDYSGDIVDFIPIIGLKTLDSTPTATDPMRVYGWRISRLYGPKTA